MAWAMLGVCTTIASALHAAPMARLEAGPAPAIRAARPGLVDSDSMVDKPPSKKRVMLRTGMPWARATSEWASSCTSTETKSSRAAARATVQVVAVDQPSTGNHDSASEKVISAKMMIQLGWMAMSMPKSRPILKPGPMCLLWSRLRIVPVCDAGERRQRLVELDYGVEAVGYGQHASLRTACATSRGEGLVD